ncbi:MAG: glycosyltransferase [Cyanobacteriota bacterium]|nr:glycosyltransferase [Cyanobacteriota bacterium]
MPLFNAEIYLAEALQSILSQSFAHFTLLISDNASTDATESICRAFAQTDSRISYFRQSTNKGACHNFQITLNAAETPFFMWAAGDDLWDADYLATCISCFEADADLALVATLTSPFTDEVFREPCRSLLLLPSTTAWKTRYNFLRQPEGMGKANLIYGVFRTDLLKAVAGKAPLTESWGADMHLVYNYLCVGRLCVVDRPMFFKRQPAVTVARACWTGEGLRPGDHERIACKELRSTWRRYSSYYLTYVLTDAQDVHAPFHERLRLMACAVILLCRKIWAPFYRLAEMIVRHRSDRINKFAASLRPRRLRHRRSSSRSTHVP